MNYEDSLIIKTAWYYYIENMTQQKKFPKNWEYPV